MPPTTMLCDSTAGGLMSKLLPPQMSSAACWNRKAKPTVSSTWRSGSKPSWRRNTRSISKPTMRDGAGRDRDRQQPGAGGPDHGERDIAAQHEIGAVRQVDDAHHAENQRQAAAHQEQQRAIGNAVEGLDQPEIQVHPHSRNLNPRGQAYMRPRRWPERREVSNERPLALSCRVPEFLRAAAVADLGGVEIALGIDGDVVHPLELAGLAAVAAPLGEHFAGVAAAA